MVRDWQNIDTGPSATPVSTCCQALVVGVSCVRIILRCRRLLVSMAKTKLALASPALTTVVALTILSYCVSKAPVTDSVASSSDGGSPPQSTEVAVDSVPSKRTNDRAFIVMLLFPVPRATTAHATCGDDRIRGGIVETPDSPVWARVSGHSRNRTRSR